MINHIKEIMFMLILEEQEKNNCGDCAGDGVDG